VIDCLFAMLAQTTPLAIDATPAIVRKLPYVWPEVALFVGACVVMVLGLSKSLPARRSCAAVSVVALVASGLLAMLGPTPEFTPMPGLMGFAKVLIAAVGVLLILMLTGTVDRDYESAVARGVPFDAIRSTRGEFYAFALFSLLGLMLCASADDLIWLFLALELTSLPTYVMVSISSSRSKAQEAGVKYFFLGALGAAMFLYGFALLYGATGTTLLFGDGETPGIAEVFATEGVGVIATVGIIVSLVGLCFKIAAVPMHYYTPDVYEGAATSVAAFLAFVPKAAGFLAIILLLSTVGWTFAGGAGHGDSLPEAVRAVLWVIAALTMTIGNVLALLQRTVKRILAYSSIAHSGYMLVGVIAGPGDGVLTNGLGATLFYLLCYGFMNLGAFAVLGALERKGGQEIETIEDLRGLCSTHKWLGWTMVLSSLSLLGLPPLLGFFGKLYLFAAGIGAGEITLVVIMGLNSAIAAFYYLRLAGAPVLESPAPGAGPAERSLFPARAFAGIVSAVSVLALVPAASWLIHKSDEAARLRAEPISTPRADADSTESDLNR